MIFFLYGRGGTFDFISRGGGGRQVVKINLKKRRGSSGGGITAKLK